jgi:FkbM family methyltransferase
MLKEIIRSFAKRCGYEILGPTRSYAGERSIVALLRKEEINLVLDIGANLGQFADGLLAAGYSGRIVSFEPLSTIHSQLRANASRYPNWTVADRTALGEKAGSVRIHVSTAHASSSILEMLPSHLKAAPGSDYVGAETVPVNRLDDLCALSPADRVVLKIDVQGYERQVLEGAPRVLGSCRAVITEMSLAPLYEGQVLVKDLWDLLASHGFEVWSLEPGFRDPATGRMLQFDGVFVRGEDKP